MVFDISELYQKHKILKFDNDLLEIIYTRESDARWHMTNVKAYKR